MKKISLLLAVVSVFSLTSCKDDKNAIENQNVTNSTATQGKETSKNKSISSEIPNFSDPEVQKHIEKYDAFVKDYLAAIKEKDIIKMEELGPKVHEWATKEQLVLKKLAADPTEAKKYNEYIQKLAQEIQKAMTE
jgi:hypothetical protein